MTYQKPKYKITDIVIVVDRNTGEMYQAIIKSATKPNYGQSWLYGLSTNPDFKCDELDIITTL